MNSEGLDSSCVCCIINNHSKCVLKLEPRGHKIKKDSK